MLSDYEREEDDDTNEGGFASSPLRRRLRVEKNVASQKIDFGLQQALRVMKRAQESLEIATQENKALTEQVLLKNRDLKRFALRCMCMKIELALSNAGLSRYSRTKRSFETWFRYCQYKSKEERTVERIIRKFCHDKYFSAAFHHWVDVTRIETNKRKTLTHIISRAMLFRERKMQRCWSKWKNQTLRATHSINTKKQSLLKKERMDMEAKMREDMNLRNAKIAYLESSLNRQVQDRMRSAIGALTSTYVRSHITMKQDAFRKWIEFLRYLEQEKHRKAQLTLAMWKRGENVTKDLLLCAIAKWKRFVRNTKNSDRKRRLLSRLKARTNIHLESYYFSRWNKWVQDRVGARSLGHLRKERVKHGLRILSHISTRRFDRSILRAFRTWVDRTWRLRLGKKYLVALMESLREFRDAALRDAFEAWRDAMRLVRTQNLLSQLAKTTVALDSRVARTDSRRLPPRSPRLPPPTSPLFDNDNENDEFDDVGFDTVEEGD